MEAFWDGFEKRALLSDIGMTNSPFVTTVVTEMATPAALPILAAVNANNDEMEAAPAHNSLTNLVERGKNRAEGALNNILKRMESTPLEQIKQRKKRTKR